MNTEILKKLVSPNYDFNVFIKINNTSELNRIISEMGLSLAEFEKVSKNEDKIVNSRHNLSQLKSICLWIEKLWDAGSSKQNHNYHLTQYLMSILRENEDLKKENEKLKNIIDE